MRRRYLVTFGAILGLTVPACEGELETNFGPPGGLNGAMIPTPLPTDSGASKHDGATMMKCKSVAPKDSGSMDTGTVTDATSDATSDTMDEEEAAAADASAPETGAVDAGPPAVKDDCKVSWTGDIWPKMTAGGAWACGNATCHGGGNSPMLSGNAYDYYTSLVDYIDMLAPQPIPFVVPCSTDTKKSAFICVTTTSDCGLMMPETTLGVTATPLSKSDVDMVTTWIGCGSQYD
jgi:hypothetical protein